MNAIGGWQVFNGNAVYGTTLTAAPTTPNGSTFQGTPVDFAAAQADLLAKSAYWAALPATGSSVFQFSTLTLTGNNPVLNVFQVTEAAWENSNDKQINIPVGSTVLINIAGTNVAFNGGLAINGQQNQFDPAIPGILYNFASATTLQPSNIAVLGSVLAPLADLTLTGGNINGITVVANALTQSGGEFHNRGFTGTLPNPPVPEPCSVALGLGGMLIGLVGTRRR
jgi:choice-of-anchor A domain-containing protein